MSFNGSTKTFDSIADLKLQSANSNIKVNVLGYYAPGDGGGGEFYWDSSSTEADNSGTIIQVTGVTTGRWKRNLQGNTLNILWFGAKNDYTSTSTTNNAPSINAAMTAAATLRTSGIESQTQGSIVSVYFPYGKGFRITDTINVSNNISVIMDGQVVFDNTANDRPAIVIGDSTLTQRKQHIIDVTNKNATTWPAEDVNGVFSTISTGVKLVNQYWCEITIRRAANFTVGVQCYGDTLGFVYNEVKLGILAGNKVGLDLSGETSGWCNENNFYGGRFSTSSIVANNGKNRYGIRITDTDGTYTNHNNNNFHKPCFELNGTIANPGIALPILIVHGTTNAFYDCRTEGNYVASTALIRTLNDSAQNFVDVGFGIDGTVEDLGNYPSTITYRRGKLLTDKNYISVFDSGDLLRRVCPYDATNVFVSDELILLNSGDANVYDFFTSITLNATSVQFPSSRGLGVRIDTTSNKRFVVKKSTVSGAGGRTCVRCFNASGSILYSATTPYVKGYPFSIPSANSTFGGHYRSGTDTSSPLYFTVDDDVAYIDVFVSGGTNPIQIKQFQVQAIDSEAAIISQKKKTGLHAIQIPTSGTWEVGDVINNAVPTTNSIVGWQCTVAGTPGTWVPIYNANKTVTSVNGSTGDVTVAPVSGSGNYIQNQIAAAQTADFWVNGRYILGTSGSERLSARFNAIAFNRDVTSGTIYTTSGYAYQLVHVASTTSTSDTLRFSIYDPTGANVTQAAIAINGLGNVGINTTTPSTNLHISGSTRFDLGSDATGDIFYRNSSGNFTRLPIGAAGQLVRVNTGATAPEYFTPSYISGNQTITLTGDVTGSGNTSITTTLANVGTSGTYTKVTTDSKGRVVSGTTLAAGDIPAGSGNYIQNQNVSPQIGNFRITGNAVIQKDGAATILPSYLLWNAAGTRGANFQLDANTNPGLNLWIHDGSAWQNRMTWDATGNVGVGTTSPLTRFHISGTSTADFYVVNTSAFGGTTGAFCRFLNAGTPTATNQVLGGLILGTNSTGSTVRTGAQIEARSAVTWVDGSNHGTDLLFYTVTNGVTTVTEKMRITNSGNVGIGTTSPTFKLQTLGSVLFGAAASEDGNVNIDVAGVSRTTITTFRTGGRTGIINNSTEAISILTSGNVGIGTNSPDTKLEVAGQVKITGGSPGANKVLTSDANGLATWQTPVINTTYSVVIPPTTANYTALATDYYIILKPITTGANRTVILPDPTTVTGKTYMIMYDAGASGGTFSWGVSRNIYDAKGGFRVGFNPALGTTLLFFSDGTNWRLMDEWT